MFTITCNFLLYHCMQYIPLPYPFHQYTNAITWAPKNQTLLNYIGLWHNPCIFLGISSPLTQPNQGHNIPPHNPRFRWVLATINGNAQLHHDVAKRLQPVKVDKVEVIPTNFLRGKPKKKRENPIFSVSAMAIGWGPLPGPRCQWSPWRFSSGARAIKTNRWLFHWHCGWGIPPSYRDFRILIYKDQLGVSWNPITIVGCILP